MSANGRLGILQNYDGEGNGDVYIIDYVSKAKPLRVHQVFL